MAHFFTSLTFADVDNILKPLFISVGRLSSLKTLSMHLNTSCRTVHWRHRVSNVHWRFTLGMLSSARALSVREVNIFVAPATWLLSLMADVENTARLDSICSRYAGLKVFTLHCTCPEEDEVELRTRVDVRRLYPILAGSRKICLKIESV